MYYISQIQAILGIFPFVYTPIFLNVVDRVFQFQIPLKSIWLQLL